MQINDQATPDQDPHNSDQDSSNSDQGDSDSDQNVLYKGFQYDRDQGDSDSDYFPEVPQYLTTESLSPSIDINKTLPKSSSNSSLSSLSLSIHSV